MFDTDELENVKNVDLSYVKEFVIDEFYTEITSTRAPYRLLAYMASKYNNETIYDLGTYRGWSSLALAANPTNKVISYDIVNYLAVKKKDNVEYIVGNFYDDPGLLKSPLISLDIDPHDGPAEIKFFEWLVENNYKGTVICDDINLNPGMVQFWNSVKNLEKYDVSKYGHQYGGTGLVFFK